MTPPQQFLQLTYTGITEGALLALIALGLVLVYKSSDVINFAHGEFMLMGAYVVWQMLTWLAPIASPPIAVIAGLILAALVMVGVGVLVERLVLRPLIGEPVISVIMVTIGLSSIINALVGGIWGTTSRPFPMEIVPFVGRFEIMFEGARRPLLLPHDRLFTVALVAVLVAGLIWFFRQSKHGIAMRAAADDQQAAMSMGISIKTVFALAWSIAAVTAAAAGLLVANLTSVSSDISGVGLRAFPVIILGGLDSIPGAILGGLIIGLIEQYVSGYVDPSLKSVIPYVVLIVILMFRPYGLFGQKRIERV